MAKYRLLAISFVPRVPGGEPELLPAGTEIEFDGMAGSNLELVSGKPADEMAVLRKKAAALKLKPPKEATADQLKALIKARTTASGG